MNSSPESLISRKLSEVRAWYRPGLDTSRPCREIEEVKDAGVNPETVKQEEKDKTRGPAKKQHQSLMLLYL